MRFLDNISDDRLISINVWGKGLLNFLVPISVLGILSPLYSLYYIEAEADYQLNTLEILYDIYTSKALLKLLLFIIPTIICIVLAKWTNHKLK